MACLHSVYVHKTKHPSFPSFTNHDLILLLQCSLSPRITRFESAIFAHGTTEMIVKGEIYFSGLEWC